MDILASSDQIVLAAQRATKSALIVFTNVPDPVAVGLVESLVLTPNCISSAIAISAWVGKDGIVKFSLFSEGYFMGKEPRRRDFLKSSGAIAGTIITSHLFPSSGLANSEKFAADPKTIELWMDQWITPNKKLDGALFVGRFADPMYFLTKSITWTPNAGQEAFKSVTVPVGFVTDFASIPRIFWSALRPDGTYTYPAIVHDYLYWMQERPKDDADQILKFGMEDLSVDSVSSIAIYNGVHFFGGSAWDSNKKLKSQGEKRILKRFPEDPTTTWEKWKKQPDVFL